MRPPAPAATACWPSPTQCRSRAAQSPGPAETAPPRARPPPADEWQRQCCGAASCRCRCVVVRPSNCCPQGTLPTSNHCRRATHPPTQCLHRSPTHHPALHPSHLRPVHSSQAGVRLGIGGHLAHHSLDHAPCAPGVPCLEQQRGLPQAVACGVWNGAGEAWESASQACVRQTDRQQGGTAQGACHSSPTVSEGKSILARQRPLCRTRQPGCQVGGLSKVGQSAVKVAEPHVDVAPAVWA